EDILELLAGGDIHRRRYEMDVLATEPMNRLRRLRERLASTTQATGEIIQAAKEGAALAVGAATDSEHAIVEHVQTRQDQVAHEPEAARVATEAAERVRDQLDDAGAAHETLRELDEETWKSSRRADR